MKGIITSGIEKVALPNELQSVNSGVEEERPGKNDGISL